VVTRWNSPSRERGEESGTYMLMSILQRYPEAKGGPGPEEE
jgi:hypothetical protein